MLGTNKVVVVVVVVDTLSIQFKARFCQTSALRKFHLAPCASSLETLPHIELNALTTVSIATVV